MEADLVHQRSSSLARAVGATHIADALHGRDRLVPARRRVVVPARAQCEADDCDPLVDRLESVVGGGQQARIGAAGDCSVARVELRQPAEWLVRLVAHDEVPDGRVCACELREESHVPRAVDRVRRDCVRGLLEDGEREPDTASGRELDRRVERLLPVDLRRLLRVPDDRRAGSPSGRPRPSCRRSARPARASSPAGCRRRRRRAPPARRQGRRARRARTRA